MAAEQVQGEEADPRTDIFAFGAVLYEMVTGSLAFEGKSQASLMAAILEHQARPISKPLRIADAGRLQPMSSREPRAVRAREWGAAGVRALEHVVTRCLAKAPDDRWQTARDATAGSQTAQLTWFDLRTEFNEHNGQVSPDGRWMAYASDEAGRWEVYVGAFPVLGARWQVSTSGGSQPRWRQDGKALFYLSPDGTILDTTFQR